MMKKSVSPPVHIFFFFFTSNSIGLLYTILYMAPYLGDAAICSWVLSLGDQII